MTPVEIIGWLAAAVGTVLGLPQLARLLRTHSVEGLSLIAWQIMLAVNLSWAAHGVRIQQPPQIITSAFSLFATAPILFLMSRHLGRRVSHVLAPGLAVAAVMVLVDQALGSAAFGMASVVPAVVSNVRQGLELVRAPDVRGVSGGFLGLAVLNQCLWFSWAMLVGDAGSIIAALVTGACVAFNLAWYLLRRIGVRALGSLDAASDWDAEAAVALVEAPR